ncbi:MAG: response regulator [Salibacteraceae bacterium]
MTRIKILLVDDHKVVRDGIRSYLESEDQFEIIGEAPNGKLALDLLKEQAADVVVMDISMEVMDGITATQEVVAQYPNTKVLAMTMLNENVHIKQMMNAGASGYLLKNSGEDEVKSAILTLAQGGAYYSQEVTQTVMNNLSNRRPASKTSAYSTEIPLTDREKEVLRLIMEEFSNQEIADKLFISPRTVDAHKRNLLEKTGSKNVAGLVMYAVSNRIFDDLV